MRESLTRLSYWVRQRHELIARVSREPIALDLARTLSAQYDTLNGAEAAKTWVYENESLIAIYFGGTAIDIRETK